MDHKVTYRWNCVDGHKLFDRYEYLAESLPDGMDDPRADAAWQAWKDHKDSCPACSGLKQKRDCPVCGENGKVKDG